MLLGLEHENGYLRNLFEMDDLTRNIFDSGGEITLKTLMLMQLEDATQLITELSSRVQKSELHRLTDKSLVSSIAKIIVQLLVALYIKNAGQDRFLLEKVVMTAQ